MHRKGIITWSKPKQGYKLIQLKSVVSLSSFTYKNIIIIGPAHPLRGGLSTFNHRLAQEFNAQGYHTAIYSFSLQYPGFLFPGTSQYSAEPRPAELDIHTRINSVNPLNWLSAGRELKKLRPDIIIVRYWIPLMGPCLGTILRMVKKNHHTKIICIADNILPHEKRLGDSWFTRYFINAVDGFITMSEKVMADLRLFTKDKPAKQVAHPLYDNFGEKVSMQEARKKLKIDTDLSVILFFGFIRKYKGLDLLLDAMKIIADSEMPGTNKIRLLIAGEFYEDKNTYEEQINRLGIRDKLILHTDFIPDSEVKYYLCAADLLVQPYRNATQSGVTPLAYHFDLPMVVTNVGGLPALVPDNKAGLVAEATAVSLAGKILEYFERGKNHFSPFIAEEKKKLSWAKIMESIIEVANCK